MSNRGYRIFCWLATRGVKRQLTQDDYDFLREMYDIMRGKS